jgi:hypothetical protein
MSNGGYSLLNHAAKAKIAKASDKPIQHQDLFLYSSLKGLHAKQVAFHPHHFSIKSSPSSSAAGKEVNTGLLLNDADSGAYSMINPSGPKAPGNES